MSHQYYSFPKLGQALKNDKMNPFLFAFKNPISPILQAPSLCKFQSPTKPYHARFLALDWALGNRSEMTGRGLADPVHGSFGDWPGWIPSRLPLP